jgi:shikimate kinase
LVLAQGQGCPQCPTLNGDCYCGLKVLGCLAIYPLPITLESTIHPWYFAGSLTMTHHFLKGTNVYLIGMMGAGKSTVGRQLAKALGYGFLDTDAVIVQTAGQSIDQIFAHQGEAAFRDLETQVLSQVAAHTRLVIATGGGIVLRQINWSYLQHGVVVWLDVPVEELVKRLSQDTSRPLLKGVNLHQTLSELLAQRRARYAQADVRIDGQAAGQTSTSAITQRIIDRLQAIIKSPEKPVSETN